MENFTNVNNKYIFYYDETNNIRKFWFKNENKLNIPKKDLTKNFVLGGIVQLKVQPQPNINGLKTSLNLQNNIQEIKLKHIAKGSFTDCIKSQKLEIFLDWLSANNLLIHYSSLNIIYWSIVDIIDSLEGITNHFEIHHQLKTILYEISKQDLDTFLDLIHKYDYPNVKREIARNFLDELSHFIKSNKSEFIKKYPSTEELINIIVDLLANADEQDLTFIMDEEDHILIDNLFPFYIRNFTIFKNSHHILDEEPLIQEYFEKYKFYDDQTQWNNFQFKDSISTPLIQVSDIVTGLLGKLFDYINNLPNDEINSIKNLLNAQQQTNFSLLVALLIRSELHSSAFAHSTQGLLDYERFYAVLEKFR
jgi:hypothetical protein